MEEIDRIMNGPGTRHPGSPDAQVPVLPTEEIADLVKESEVRTGAPGRHFIIHGAERFAYRVSVHPGGLEISRIDDDGRPTRCVFASTKSFETHPLAIAQRDGCLFTQPHS